MNNPTDLSPEETLWLAERVCALYGWTGVTRDPSPREKALHQAWSEWAAARPALTGPGAWPDLDVDALAAERDRIRDEALARLPVEVSR